MLRYTLGAKVNNSPFGPEHWKLTPNRKPPVANEPSLRKSRLEGMNTSLVLSGSLDLNTGMKLFMA
jgi:hypothetical protein